jgi:hypothetical protein
MSVFEHYDGQTKAVLEIMSKRLTEVMYTADPDLMAMIAYMAMHDALTTPHVDENHKGGNLIDLVMTLAAENYRLKNGL